MDFADDGLQAHEKALAKKYDLILMDVKMPIMDGFTVTGLIRSVGITVPIIAITANALVGDREKCLEAGMDDYVSKPVSLTALTNTVLKYI